MKKFTCIIITLFLFFSWQLSHGQGQNDPFEAFKQALMRSSPAATVGCVDDQIRFKNIKLEDGKLRFMLLTGSPNNLTEETYIIDLELLSTASYTYTEQNCVAELGLESKEGVKAFHVREFDYVGNRLEDHREETRRQISFRINKDPGRNIAKTLFQLAEAYN